MTESDFRALPLRKRLRIVRAVERGHGISDDELAAATQWYARRLLDEATGRGVWRRLNLPPLYWFTLIIVVFGVGQFWDAPLYWVALLGVLVIGVPWARRRMKREIRHAQQTIELTGQRAAGH